MSSRLTRAIKALVTGSVLFIGLPALAIMLLWGGRCKETVLDERASPDARFTAQTAQKNCGESQPVATLVRVLEKDGGKSSESDNLLLIEGPTAEVQTSWSDAATVAIAVPKGSKVVYRRHQWNGLKATFAER